MSFLLPIPDELTAVAEVLSASGAILSVQDVNESPLISNGDLADIQGLHLVMNQVPGEMDPLFGPPNMNGVPTIYLPGGATLVFDARTPRDSRSGAHLRSVLASAAQIGSAGLGGTSSTMLSGGWKLSKASPSLVKAADSAATGFSTWSNRSKKDFANSASYMGSKRALIPFLMQPLSDWLRDETVFVDLMCGSGSVTGAAAMSWTAIASDAQSFCTTLAAIQSGGYSRSRAEGVIDELQEPMIANIDWLSARLSSLLTLEEDLFHSSSDFVSAADEYREFIARLPTYPRGERYGSWDPVAEVEARRVAPGFSLPSCLFTAYYADLYVGLRQAIEIDSIRHAISCLANPTDRRWALGALVVATSRIATSYAGHFAQPFAPSGRLSDPRLFNRVAMQRSMSIVLEFEKRFLTLAHESESVTHVVQVIPGPWRNALEGVAAEFPHADVAVYVDAPYRREEYSRYYHLLETLVQYNYPSASTWARMPEKGPGKRFSSEFFTRSRPRMAHALANVLSEILGKGWRCAWSYGEDADAHIGDVLNALPKAPSRLRGIAAEHAYSWQGKSDRHRTGPKLARELLVMMDP